MYFNLYFIFRERGKEGEREGEKHQLVASRTTPAGDLARNPGTCPDWALNRWHFSLQDSAQSTESHQSGWENQSWIMLAFGNNPQKKSNPHYLVQIVWVDLKWKTSVSYIILTVILSCHINLKVFTTAVSLGRKG